MNLAYFKRELHNPFEDPALENNSQHLQERDTKLMTSDILRRELYSKTEYFADSIEVVI